MPKHPPNDVSIGKFDILATYTYVKGLLDGLDDDEAKERGMVAAILGAKVRLVHGILWSEMIGKRIGQAWCERGEVGVDLVMPVGSRTIERGPSYRFVKPEVRKVYSFDLGLMPFVKQGHQASWDESESLME